MEYVRALAEEMALWTEKLPGFRADTVFVGGGTPSVLEPPELDVVFRGIHACFSPEPGAEFTVECNPGTVTEEKLRFMKAAGVNRLSFGMQSTVDEELAALGRIHSFRDFLDNYDKSIKCGFNNINIDLMSAIPGQTLASYEASVERVLRLSPNHLSSYSLIVEEGTPFYEKYKDNPPVDEETDRNMYQRTGELLSAAGYRRYEISNYARRGYECRHNLKYWRREAYLGVGLGAASFLSHKRFRNEAEWIRYRDGIRAGKVPVCETESLTRADEKAEFMFLGLRCMKGISAGDFEREFGESLGECYGKNIDKLVRQGLLQRDGERIFLTARGIDVSNRVFADFV